MTKRPWSYIVRKMPFLRDGATLAYRWEVWGGDGAEHIGSVDYMPRTMIAHFTTESAALAFIDKSTAPR